jgi:hypothetical protein
MVRLRVNDLFSAFIGHPLRGAQAEFESRHKTNWRKRIFREFEVSLLTSAATRWEAATRRLPGPGRVGVPGG